MDEATADLLVSRRFMDLAALGADAAALAQFVADLHATALDPPARLSPALAAVLRDGLPTPSFVIPEGTAVRRPRQPGKWRRKVTAVGIGIGVAVSGVTVAAAANLLPAGLERVAGSVVEALTPLEIQSPAPPATTQAERRKAASDTVEAGRPDESGGQNTGGTTSDPLSGGATGGPAGAGGSGAASLPDGSGSAVPPPANSIPSAPSTSGTPAVSPPLVPHPNDAPTIGPRPTTPSVPGIPTTSVPPVTTPSTTPPGLPLP